MNVNVRDVSPLFSFDGRHCSEFGVMFLPSEYPFVPAQTVPSLTVSGRHGSLRWPGRTYRERTYKGTLYWLSQGGSPEPIDTNCMLRRASEIAVWLCGRDGRGRLVLDALPDRYYIAEVNTEALLKDDGWLNGEAAICFVCQPFAHSMIDDFSELQTTADTAKTTALYASGNSETMLAFRVTNTSGSTMDTMEISVRSMRIAFDALALADGETLAASYTDDDILLLQIEGEDGALRSAMAMRTTDSDDDLLLAPGYNEVTISTQLACSVRLSARGRWL